MTGPRIVVLGSANMDLVATTASLPRPGETVLGRDFTTVAGGKGANQAVAVARAGGDCAFIGAVGTDAFGEQLHAQLRSDRIDTSLVRVVSGPSGVALIAVDDDGENTIVVAPGANAALTSLSAADRTAIAAADVLMCQLEIPVETVLDAAVAAHADDDASGPAGGGTTGGRTTGGRTTGPGGVRVVLNAAPARPLPAGLAASVDLLIVNQVEAQTIAGPAAAADPDWLLDTLVTLVPRVVLTLGPAGAAYADGDGARLRVPAPIVSTVDSTAAGDAFAGALVVAWAEGRATAEALRWACAAGAVCATRRGASGALPVRAEIDELFRATYGSAG
jgi:ribokinase